MSINIYLKDEVKKESGFESKPYRDGSGNDMKFKGMNVLASTSMKMPKRKLNSNNLVATSKTTC
ncbi:MAG: hypothetical protein NTZ38_02270 [Candidatus Taylorbacteria bacterium]|nr:hypothetical protein [Candidatus Taylorbacteria bacterium]